ncbi:Gfo/Idh/MocA family protein [Gloeothece verrucosa]|uniref:Oxidoreductase domain protein n=1 Tax=Gloeothece verrucosa (strain PCC 7822) TaxID=497965 RepID=E0UKR8_GLOV7|nr:Gfo/Idh/MocA family oxidoreductase [Gloeothece verrucosa]ADN17548.1 oxidoreductase domain protein [Gloeothece verrucosa PCC 7822]
MPLSNISDSNANNKRKIRYAIVGVGWFAQAATLPSFVHAENSEVVAFVSDDPAKKDELAQHYGVKLTYSYDEYEKCLSSGEIDAVYIALPNHLHCEYTVRAANQGIHILCEKPMALNEDECQQMIEACKNNNVKLMIAYRLHFEEGNLQAIKTAQSGEIGEVRIFNSVFTQQVTPGNIRLQKAKGGGTLYDIGIYCINAARYLFRSEPIEVFVTSATKKNDERFSEVSEMTSAILRFPEERLATFTCSFGAASVSSYHLVGTIGDLRVDPAYPWKGEIKHYLTIEDKKQERSFESRDQLAAELLYFSDCILQNKDPEPSGIEGLNDVRIINALHRSLETGNVVQLGHLDYHQRPTVEQSIQLPPHQKGPDLVDATPASQ